MASDAQVADAAVGEVLSTSTSTALADALVRRDRAQEIAEERLAAGGMVAEVRVAGFPVAPPREPIAPEDCPHDQRLLIAEPSLGIVLADDGVTVEGWEVRVRVACGSCTETFDLDLESARAPADGGHGTVFELVPTHRKQEAR